MKKLFAVISILIGLASHAHAASLPSFWCSFTEPFITVSMARNGIYYDDNDQHVGFALRPVLRKQGADFMLSGRLKDGSSFALKISKGEGSDGMSDFGLATE